MREERVSVVGYRGVTHSFELGDRVADEDGRGGEVLGVDYSLDVGDLLVMVRPLNGPETIVLEGKKISFVAPKDE